MSNFEKAVNVAKMFETSISALRDIQTLTKTGGDKAHDTLVIIDAIVSAVIDAIANHDKPEDVEQRIKSLKDHLALNDAEIDRRAKAKFGSPETD